MGDDNNCTSRIFNSVANNNHPIKGTINNLLSKFPTVYDNKLKVNDNNKT